VFAIAITLLVLDLAIPGSGPALDRVFDAWPFYLAYVVSFLTIGAAWLAHTWITDRLTNADLPLLRLNLLLLLVVALLPFPTRLVAEGLDDVSGERVFVTMSGIALLGIRVLLYALDAYAWRERLYASGGLRRARHRAAKHPARRRGVHGRDPHRARRAGGRGRAVLRHCGRPGRSVR
jgi:TMEM175 potassium channel family protein